jgi:hypothetical protein
MIYCNYNRKINCVCVCVCVLQSLCDLGQFEKADKQFMTALELEPDNANTIVHRGYVYLFIYLFEYLCSVSSKRFTFTLTLLAMLPG